MIDFNLKPLIGCCLIAGMILGIALLGIAWFLYTHISIAIN